MEKSKWIKKPTHEGWWWMLYMTYAQEVDCKPVHLFFIKRTLCVYVDGKWVSIKKHFKDDSGFMLLGWQECPKPFFNPNDY